MKVLFRDLRFALRSLRKSPGFALTTLVILALALGSNALVFSLVDGILLQPLPYPQADQLVQVWEHNRFLDDRHATVAVANYRDWQRQSELVEVFGAYWMYGGNLWGGEVPERVPEGVATLSYFQVLGVEPHIGRLFRPEEEEWGNHRVAVISYDLWQRRFGGDEGALGQDMSLEGYAYQVVGVLPPDFEHPAPPGVETPDLWRPFAVQPEEADKREDHWFQVIARLRPGVSLSQAQSEMDAIAAGIERDFPTTNRHRGVVLEPLADYVVGDHRRELLLLLLAVGLVLVLTCANLGNLMLVRAEARSREMALRSALGAERQRLLRLVFTESALLVVLASGAGLLFAAWGRQLLVQSDLWHLPRLEATQLDGRGLAFTALLAGLATVIFGALSALGPGRLAPGRRDLHHSLRPGGRDAGGGRSARRLRSALVVVEVALALALVTSAVLVSRSYGRLLDSDPGYRIDNLLTVHLALPWGPYHEPAQMRAFYQQLLPQVRALPGVEGAAAVNLLPLDEGRTPVPFEIEGDESRAAGEAPEAELRLVTPDYLRLLAIELLEGRGFSDADRADSPGVVLVSRSVADKIWPGSSALGQRLRFIGNDQESDWLEVVGVTGDVRDATLDGPPAFEIYRPYAQHSWLNMNLVLRTRAGIEPASVTEALRREVLAIDANQPLYNVRTMEQIYSGSLSRQRFLLALLSFFALAALLISGLGIYGVMAHSVARRSREMGLRTAVGAQRGDVLTLIVREGMTLFAAGALLGLPLSLLLSYSLRHTLYTLSAFDPLSFGATGLSMGLIALAAVLIPALRATRVDPVVALRTE